MNDRDRRLSVEKKLWICGGQFSSSFCTCVMICRVDMSEKALESEKEPLTTWKPRASRQKKYGIVFPSVCACGRGGGGGGGGGGGALSGFRTPMSFPHLHGANQDVDRHEAVRPGNLHQRWCQENRNKESDGVKDPDKAVALLAQPVICTVVGRAALVARIALQRQQDNAARRALSS